MISKRINKFIKNPKKALWILSFPILIAMVVQTTNNIVDTAFVGRLGAEAIAALTFSFPLFFILIAITSGLSIGINSRISGFLGEKNKKAAENTAIHRIFKIWGKVFSGNLMYFPGCLTHFVMPEIEDNYKQILTKLNTDFINLDNFNCCGSPVLHAGYRDDFNDLLKKNLKFFKEYNVKRFVTNCPACFKFLKEQYDMPIQHMSQLLYENMDKLKTIYDEEITYHDPCHLGRHSSVDDEPRKVLEKIGFKIKELDLCRDRSYCCGGGGNLRTNNSEMSEKIAKQILKQVKTKKLVSPCPLCYRQFLDNAKEFGIEIIEFSDLILPAL